MTTTLQQPRPKYYTEEEIERYLVLVNDFDGMVLQTQTPWSWPGETACACCYNEPIAFIGQCLCA
jgi:hypothetical protein